MIYNYIFEGGTWRIITEEKTFAFSHNISLAMLCVNRQLRKETYIFPFSLTTFVFYTSRVTTFIKRLTKRQRDAIQRIRLLTWITGWERLVFETKPLKRVKITCLGQLSGLTRVEVTIDDAYYDTGKRHIDGMYRAMVEKWLQDVKQAVRLRNGPAVELLVRASHKGDW